jgi:hypothetical protein
MEPLPDLLARGRLEKQVRCFFEILTCLLNGIALTGNVKLRAQRHVSVAYPFNDRSKSLGHGFPFFLDLLSLYTTRKGYREHEISRGLNFDDTQEALQSFIDESKRIFIRDGYQRWEPIYE